MQPPTAGPRAALTEAQVVALIQDAPAVTVSAGAELLDQALNVIEDITADLLGGSVQRQAYATLHGTAQLQIARELNWANAIVRPYMVLTDGTTTARFNLGAYYATSPKAPAGSSPPVYDVAGYDILQALDTPVGDAYAADTGNSYLATVTTILQAQGYTKYRVDQTAADKTLPSPRVWPIDERTTWLTVVNDLLAAVGYQGIWSDWDGQLVIQPYDNPNDRDAERVYDTGIYSSMLLPDRSRNRDFFNAPNRWVAIRSNNLEGATPIEGDGIYTYVNQSDGDTSVEARGRVITRILSLEAADQASLVSQANRSIGADLRQKSTIECSTFPNPLHWHFDRMLVDDDDLGGLFDVLGTQWTLPLNGEPMQHSWSVL